MGNQSSSSSSSSSSSKATSAATARTTATSSRKFKGTGKVLSTGENVAPPPRRMFGGVASTGSNRKSKGGGVRNDPQREQDAERLRTLQAAAAERRDKQWDIRVAKQRAARLAREREEHEKGKKENDLDSSGNRNERKDLSGPLEDTPDDPQVAAKLARDAQQIETSGFNPYGAVITSSQNAQAAFSGTTAGTVGSVDGGAATDRTTVANTEGANTSLYGNAADDARYELDDAMMSSDPDRLQEAISRAYHAKVDEALLDEASQLLSLLQLGESSVTGGAGNQDQDQDQGQGQGQGQGQDPSIEEVKQWADNAVDLLISRGRETDPKDIIKTCKTLKTLLTNLVEHSDEPKYRKIRLANKTIHTRIVETAGGAGLNVLIAVGFHNTKDPETDEDCLEVPDPSTRPPDEVERAHEACKVVLHRLEEVLSSASATASSS